MLLLTPKRFAVALFAVLLASAHITHALPIFDFLSDNESPTITTDPLLSVPERDAMTPNIETTTSSTQHIPKSILGKLFGTKADLWYRQRQFETLQAEKERCGILLAQIEVEKKRSIVMPNHVDDYYIRRLGHLETNLKDLQYELKTLQTAQQHSIIANEDIPEHIIERIKVISADMDEARTFIDLTHDSHQKALDLWTKQRNDWRHAEREECERILAEYESERIALESLRL